MLDEAVSALPRHMTSLSISTVATAGSSDPGETGLNTPQSSVTSDAGLPASAYQLTSQVVLHLGSGRLCENPIVDSIGQNNRQMR